MKSHRQRWSYAWAALVVGTFCARSGTAWAKKVELAVEAGALVGVGIPEMSPRPTLSGDVKFLWAPRPTFQLGLDLGLGMTVLPYGCSDAVPFIGERGRSGCGSALSENLTFMPRALFAARFILGPRAAVGVSAGATFLVAHGVAEYALYPYPTIGVNFATKVSDRLQLSAGIGYVDIAYRESRGFLFPTLALAWQ